MFPTARFESSYRAESEDRATIVSVEGGVVLAVADGVGGQSHGGAAAEYAIGRVTEFAGSGDISDPRRWYALVKAIDHELLTADNLGQTTLAAVALLERAVVGVSVGDSGALLIRAEGHYDLTEAQQRKPYLGSGAEPVPFALPLPSEGTLVVATDGLWKYAPVEQILGDALNPDLDITVQQIARRACLPSGKYPDDIAVLLCRFTRPATSWSARLTNRLTRFFQPYESRK